MPGAAALAALLVAGHVALGGGGYEPRPVASPCAPRARPDVERVQLVALAALDGAACRLRTSREELTRNLLRLRLPPGASGDEIGVALEAGIDRARRERALGRVAAAALRLLLKTGGPQAVLRRLLAGG